MRPLVAHCHAGLGRLCRRTGRREEAQEHLTRPKCRSGPRRWRLSCGPWPDASADREKCSGRLSREQAFDQRLSGQTEVLSYVAQDAGKGPNAEASVTRNCDVVLAVFEGGQPKMATGLTVHPVAQVGEGLREIVTGDVPRQPQAVMISSRTKWRRMTFGT